MTNMTIIDGLFNPEPFNPGPFNPELSTPFDIGIDFLKPRSWIVRGQVILSTLGTHILQGKKNSSSFFLDANHF